MRVAHVRMGLDEPDTRVSLHIQCTDNNSGANNCGDIKATNHPLLLYQLLLLGRSAHRARLDRVRQLLQVR